MFELDKILNLIDCLVTFLLTYPDGNLRFWFTLRFSLDFFKENEVEIKRLKTLGKKFLTQYNDKDSVFVSHCLDDFLFLMALKKISYDEVCKYGLNYRSSCYHCESPLSLTGILHRETISLDSILNLWFNSYIKFYCCHCFKAINKGDLKVL